VPQGLVDEECAWAAIPLLHHQRLVGVVVLAAPEFRRQLDWEDRDLLRTAGHQAASSLAEALGRTRLARRNGSRSSTAASPSSSTTSRIWSANCHCSPQCRAARRQSGVQSRYGGDAEVVGRKMNELLAGSRAVVGPRAADRAAGAPADPQLGHRRQAPRPQRQPVGDTGAEVLVDASALEQVIGHLLQNALDASSGEPVSISVAATATMSPLPSPTRAWNGR